jgi:hypothetical protein
MLLRSGKIQIINKLHHFNLSINLSDYLFKQYFRQLRQIEWLFEDIEEENQNRVFYKCLSNEFFIDAQKS